MNKLAIVTPTFNRLDTLKKLYNSLLIQNTTSKFTWVVVDDGSTDETSNYINSLNPPQLFNIVYLKQQNTGKGAALNNAFNYCKDFVACVIVDSDDFLLSSALSTISKYLKIYWHNDIIGALFFYYNDLNGNNLKKRGDILTEDVILDRYEYNRLYGLNDGCVVYLNKAYTKYKYPKFQNEKYIGPTVIQMMMADEFKIVFSPIVIGVANYLPTGLSKSGRILRLNNPLGMIMYSGLMQSKNSLLVNIKNTIGAQGYRCYSKISRAELKKNDLDKYIKSWAVPFGLILALLWKIKYNHIKIIK